MKNTDFISDIVKIKLIACNIQKQKKIRKELHEI